MLASLDERKDTLKMFEGLWSKNQHNNSENFVEKYINQCQI